MKLSVSILWICVTAILQQYLCDALDAQFIRKLSTKVILPNEIATFECSVAGLGILYVNGRVPIESTEQLALKGLHYSIEEKIVGMRTFTYMKLSVKGLPSNNGSQIDCYGYDEDVIHSSSLLIIAGPPLAPDPVLSILNSTALLLSWKKPFAWNELADVDNYTVKLFNSKIGMWKEWTIKPPKHDVTNSLVINGDRDDSDKCVGLTFVVSATNRIGESQNKSVSGGLPIDMKWYGNPISASVQPHSLEGDNGADVIVQIRPPQMCSYQRANYTIAITSLKTGKKVAETVLHSQSGGGKLIELQFPVEMSDMQDQLYIAEVNATSLEANGPLVKSTKFSMPFAVGDDSSLAEEHGSNKSLLVGVVIAAVTSLVLVVILVAIVAGAKCRRLTPLKRDGSSTYMRFSNINDDHSTCT